MATESSAQDLGHTVQEITERVSLLVHEEIELAKAEVTEKITKLLRGIVIGIAAGIFVITGLLFALHGLAWLTWFVLPVGSSAFFWGFFFVAGMLFVLGGVAGYLAARFFKESTPPVPKMAIKEAEKIKKTLTFRRKRKG
ncbi:MAG: phage holin family protein [Solirubrobacteraceae bacterium]